VGTSEEAMSQQTVRLGLYGCGNRTKALLDAFAGTGRYEVVSAFDIRPQVTEELCRKYGGKPCRSAAEMLEAKGVDAVMISLAPAAHPEAFEQSLQLGKPIFLEKPIAPTAAQAFHMMRAAQAARVPVHVGLAQRYTPTSLAVKAYLDTHDPGRILAVCGHWFSLVEIEVINFRRIDPQNFRMSVSQIPFHCCHMLDLLCVLGGNVTSVQAVGVKFRDWNYVTPDEVIAILTFDSGAVGEFHYTGFCYGMQDPPLPLCVHTLNYTIDFWQWGKMRVWSRPETPEQRGERVQSGDAGDTWRKNTPSATFDPKGPSFTTAVMSDFLDSVATGTPMKVTIEDGYRVAEIAEAIEMSYKQGRKIDLPLFR
jgi:predicted dehydrogenase